LAFALAGLAGLLAGCSDIHPRGSLAVVTIEFAFSPAQATLEKGRNGEVTIVVQNTGLAVHNLVIPDLGVASPDVEPGRTARISFVPPDSGTYRYVCTKPGHEELGMVGSLTFK
jgi:plastocyanin